MSWFAFVTAVALSAAPPFPPPKALPVTDQVKCDWGSVHMVNATGTQLVVTTTVGPLTLRVDPGIQVYSPDGQAMGAATILKAGQNVRVYYVVEQGAKALEIDLQ